jgi:hypothetical protein
MGCPPNWFTPAPRSAWSRPNVWRRRAPVRAARSPLFLPPVVGVRFGLARRGTGAGAWDGRRPIFAGEGDIDAARALVEETDDAELSLYPGDQHYFADSWLPSYDSDATALLILRVLASPAPSSRGARRGSSSSPGTTS